LLVFVGKACTEVVKGTLATSVVVPPHTSAEKAGKAKVCLDTESV
jgi:hypothetical protein